MIIVIEGSDIVGKTTVVNKVVHSINDLLPIMSNKVPEDIKSDCYGKILTYNDNMMYKLFQTLNEKFSIDIIMDRFILSEIIYSKFLGRKPAETINDIINKDLHIIILHADENIIKQRYELRGDPHFKLEEILQINNLFFNFFNTYKKLIKNLYIFNNNNERDLFNIINHIRCLLKNE